MLLLDGAFFYPSIKNVEISTCNLKVCANFAQFEPEGEKREEAKEETFHIERANICYELS